MKTLAALARLANKKNLSWEKVCQLSEQARPLFDHCVPSARQVGVLRLQCMIAKNIIQAHFMLANDFFFGLMKFRIY